MINIEVDESKRDGFCESIRKAIETRIKSAFDNNPDKIIVINHDLYIRKLEDVNVWTTPCRITFRGDMSILVRTVSPDPEKFEIDMVASVKEKFFMPVSHATIENFNPVNHLLSVVAMDKEKAIEKGLVFEEDVK